MYIDQNEILIATRGGLDIILYYYPQAEKCLSTSKKKFKIRNEKTASATIKQLTDGNYVVTDFGADAKPMNGIQVCMHEEHCSFKEAIERLAARYNINGAAPVERKAEYEKRPAKTKEAEGDYFFEIKETMSDYELQTLGKHVTAEICKEYNFYALNSFSRVKNREVNTWHSTDNYPIYMVDGGKFKKIIQPFAEKQFRFQYLGERPKNVVLGLSQLKKRYAKHEKQALDAFSDDTPHIEKLPCVIIMAGDRDAINMASYGYPVVWLNSESELLSTSQIKELGKYVQKIYNVPDIDATGRKQGVKLALTYLDIQTVWLPDYLLKLKDVRGYGRKDFRDWIDSKVGNTKVEITRKIDKLLENALHAKFWYEYENEKGIQYQFSNVHCYYFLACNGYNIIEDKNEKDGYAYIHITGNTVRKIKPRDIRVFINSFLKERNMPVALRNMIIRSSQLNESSLSNIEQVDLDFTDYSKEHQYFFFNNETWKITATNIEIKRNSQSTFNAYVWNDDIIQHNVKRLQDAFIITYNAALNEFDITIHHVHSKYFAYLINTSRIHWQREDAGLTDEEKQEYWANNKFNIASDRLTADEIWEQKQHLINKIFAIGYLLHRYKSPARPWCVFAMDNKISEMRESNGGTGKSLFFKSFNHFMNTVSLGGRDPKITENKHIYERVTPYTDFLFIDDAAQYLRFDFFFDSITGSMVVNPKNTSSFEIPFEQSPKIGIASNYTLRNIDPSTSRRILYIVFSDWYHAKTENGDYSETRTVFDDFNKNLFFDYDADEWNSDINFFVECCRFFLSVPSHIKIEPPLGNVQKRNLITQMGESFKEWADMYFADNLDEYLIRNEVMEEFVKTAKPKHITSQSFKRSILSWCQYYGYSYNPEDAGSINGRIIQKYEGKTVEKIYIATKPVDIATRLLTGEIEEQDKF